MTWHQKNIIVHNHIQSGNIDRADKLLEDNKKAKEGKNKILYLLDRGVVSQMLGKYEQSIFFFSEADKLIEDYKKRLGNEAISLITNPMVKPYLPEDFEVVLINFYQSINYISSEKWEDALVECKRANIKLNQLNDKYKDHKNHYQRDAFIHLLMGLIYDAKKNYNDAFIAYRNAYEIYESDYAKNFNLSTPKQLKMDILRTASKTGFREDLAFYENKFQLKYKPNKQEGGQLLFFWLNGFGPVKSEWGFTFTSQPGDLGWVHFHNDEMGMSFPFFIGNLSDKDRNRICNLDITRIAFPKYTTRQPYFESASLSLNDSTSYKLQIVENINEIAYKVLKDRMIRELGNSLLRVALKKSVEKIIKNEDETLGFLVGIVNSLTEKADTRNWQTLPFSISYCRIPLIEGKHNLKLETQSKNEIHPQIININIKKGQTLFYTYHSLETYPYAH
jgi:hypothetical protein